MAASSSELEEIDALFARADRDHDGQIDYTEFRALVHELDDAAMDDETLRIGFVETDVDRNGRINIDEFRAWWLKD
jgi:Ca2+-binding EF-hand superfamily protein